MFDIKQVDSMFSSSSSYSCCDNKNHCSEMSVNISEEFMAKLKIGDLDTGFDDFAGKMKQHNNGKTEDQEVAYEGVDDDEDEEEFSFTCTKPDGLPISAENAFQDGQIRPIFPIFNRHLLFGEEDNGNSSKGREASSPRPSLKKIFFEEQDQHRSSSDQLEEALNRRHCEWSEKKAVDASPGLCKKSNSTGFSKLWRFRDLVTRSNSDGKDVFVFLNSNSTNTRPSNEEAKKMAKAEKIVEMEGNKRLGQQTSVKVKAKGKKGETASSVHEKLYVKNRAKKEENKRKTYLPYRVGFFTNVNGLSRNVHPF